LEGLKAHCLDDCQFAGSWAQRRFAFVVGDEAAVEGLTRAFRTDGVRVVDGPRRTGDGYYESVVLDPDGNRLELIAGKLPTIRSSDGDGNPDPDPDPDPDSDSDSDSDEA
jgi:hypothetical protein